MDAISAVQGNHAPRPEQPAGAPRSRSHVFSLRADYPRRRRACSAQWSCDRASSRALAPPRRRARASGAGSRSVDRACRKLSRMAADPFERRYFAAKALMKEGRFRGSRERAPPAADARAEARGRFAPARAIACRITGEFVEAERCLTEAVDGAPGAFQDLAGVSRAHDGGGSPVAGPNGRHSGAARRSTRRRASPFTSGSERLSTISATMRKRCAITTRETGSGRCRRGSTEKRWSRCATGWWRDSQPTSSASAAQSGWRGRLAGGRPSGVHRGHAALGNNACRADPLRRTRPLRRAAELPLDGEAGALSASQASAPVEAADRCAGRRGLPRAPARKVRARGRCG